MAMIDPGRRKPPTQITISIDETELRRVSDERLALYWHVAQANPVSIDDQKAGELAMRIGWEIIRRWLGKVEPPLYHHQQRHYHQGQLTRFARFVDGDWRAKEIPEEIHAVDPGGARPHCGARSSWTTLLPHRVTCAACKQRIAEDDPGDLDYELGTEARDCPACKGWHGPPWCADQSKITDDLTESAPIEPPGDAP